MATITHLYGHAHAPPTLMSELDSFLVYCRDRLNLAPNTRDAYRYDLTAAALLLTGPLDTIRTHEVDVYLATRQEKAGTTNRRIASLRRFFTWAVGQSYCAANPLDQIQAKRDAIHLPRPIDNTADLKALDMAIAAAPQPYRTIFTILRETGMRADEVGYGDDSRKMTPHFIVKLMVDLMRHRAKPLATEIRCCQTLVPVHPC